MKFKISINDIYKMFAGLLIICYWGFIDSVVFMRIAQILFIAICMLKITLNHGALRKTGYLQWAVCWITICLLSIIWSYNIDYSIAYFISVFQVALVGVLLVNSIDTKETVDYLEKCIVVAGIILAIRLLVTTPMSLWGSGRLGVDLGMHVNTISMNIMISELVAIKSFFATDKTTKRLVQIVSLVVAFFLAIIVFLTASKKTIVIMLLGPLLMLLFTGQKIGKKVKYVAGILLALLIGSQVIQYLPVNFEFAADRLMNAFNGLISGSTDASTSEREYLMRTAAETFSNHMILGVGLNCSRCFNNLNLYAHCNYLEILANLGVTGFVIYYYLYAKMGMIVLKAQNNKVALKHCLMILICLGILELTQVTYYYESFQLYIAILWSNIYFLSLN